MRGGEGKGRGLRGVSEDSRMYSDIKVEKDNKGFSGDRSKKMGEKRVRRGLTKTKTCAWKASWKPTKLIL